jgi:multidrug resistance efflux pump
VRCGSSTPEQTFRDPRQETTRRQPPLGTARQAFSEEAKAASDKLRADAKGIIDAAHSELKTLASLKESLEAQVRDLLRSAQDAKQRVGALAP